MGGGLVLSTQNPFIVADSVHTILTQKRFRDRILQNQQAALEYYRSYPYADMFLSFIHTVVAE